MSKRQTAKKRAKSGPRATIASQLLRQKGDNSFSHKLF
tara:strand:- start:1116 stop:1229 length:114 start_codon:yes stop_codon:yes gene_type:complete